ncbi:uncharacterized protein LOC123440962 [Hordeum vulgare subsp. vulgare]|uniref:Uncharacterized protein n=1 Tax=Hordeum vulgare subsp. vulgare TaxID=112509 RepID=A0A8I6XJK4_HORVV|nr:uncharacterized protein LOC123440962 [Hordeum vulgare subsp. vulgare]KAI5002020.1 hypothetical protein ZWY2020_026670 [Hordeum vulgare]
MGRKVCICLAILALVLLAGPGAKASPFAGGPASMDAAVAVRERMSSMKLEDGVAPELAMDLELHRRILAINVGQSALDGNRPSCIKNCPASGGAYTGRGCLKKYGCNGGS